MAGRTADGDPLPQYKSFEDVPMIVRNEYAMNHYLFRAPPVPSMCWKAVDWVNYVTFTRLHYDENGELYVRGD